MKYRRLGASGPTVSAIGLGAGSATTDFGERDDEVQIATLHRAMDLGVTLFDTADRYMKGRHERLLGRALKGRRDKAVVCTKFGNIDNPDGSKSYNGRPEYVRSACDASLAQLGIETIDLYYLHRIDPDVPIEETETLRRTTSAASSRASGPATSRRISSSSSRWRRSPRSAARRPRRSRSRGCCRRAKTSSRFREPSRKNGWSRTSPRWRSRSIRRRSTRFRPLSVRARERASATTRDIS